MLQNDEYRLMGPIRFLWHTQIDHPTGIVDVFNTRLAAGNPECDPATGIGCTSGRQDEDGDHVATRVLADDPNPFAQHYGPLPQVICWPSDHEGMQADNNCR